MSGVASTLIGGGRVANLSVCANLSGSYCPDRSAVSVTRGATAHVTVWYVGRETFTLQWFRDGQQVDSTRRSADGFNPNGYRVTFQRDVIAAGAWEVRVLNAAGNFVARQAFRVE